MTSPSQEVSRSGRRLLYVYYGKLTRHGVDLTVHHQIKSLVEAGYRLDLISRGIYPHANISNYGGRYTPANAISFLPSVYYYRAQWRWFGWAGARRLARSRHDAAIAWTGGALAMFRKAKRLGIPCVLNAPTFHVGSSGEKKPNRMWPAVNREDLCEEYKLADVLTVGSEAAAESYTSKGVDPAKVVVIGRGFDPGKAVGTTYPEGVFRLLFCGRATPRKGIVQILKAWREANLPDGELWIVGAVPRDSEVLLKAEATDTVRFHGFCDDVWEKMRQCHAQIMLSRAEGMAKALIEGASCGLATIVTRETGFPVRDGETGFLVEREDIGGVADKIRYLAGHPAECRRLGQQGREYAREHLTWGGVAERFLEALEAVMPGHGQG